MTPVLSVLCIVNHLIFKQPSKVNIFSPILWFRHGEVKLLAQGHIVSVRVRMGSLNHYAIHCLDIDVIKFILQLGKLRNRLVG